MKRCILCMRSLRILLFLFLPPKERSREKLLDKIIYREQTFGMKNIAKEKKNGVLYGVENKTKKNSK